MPNVDIPQGMDTSGSPKGQDTIGGTPAQTRSERVLAQPNEPPLSEGHTSGSGEDMMEQTFELMDNVPSIPYDSPLTGGYTLGSDEGRLKLQELMTMCTKLSKQMRRMHPNRGGVVAIYYAISHSVYGWYIYEDSYAGREKVSTDQELLEKMLNLQLEAEEESTMAFKLIKFIKSMLEE
ncbi:hypothetical protein Tco_1196515 [Tanacetum coccineum]